MENIFLFYAFIVSYGMIEDNFQRKLKQNKKELKQTDK
jgi:hypothetical protein